MQTLTNPLDAVNLNGWLMLLAIAFDGELTVNDGRLALRSPHGGNVAMVPDTDGGLDELESRGFVAVRDPRTMITSSGKYWLGRWVNRDLRWSPEYRNLIANIKRVVTAEDMDAQQARAA
jgi:hypothetical protein